MRKFDKYLMFLSEQFETSEDADVVDAPDIKLDMDDEEGMTEEERREKFDSVEEALEAIIDDEDERSEILQKIADAAGIELPEFGSKDGEFGSKDEDFGSKKDFGSKADKKGFGSKKDDGESAAFGSGTEIGK